MTIETGKRVRIKVKLQVENGEIIEDRVVEYLHGTGKMLPGLEDELHGLEAGTQKRGVIPAHNAFGGEAHRHPKKIPRSEFPDDADVQAGTSFIAGAGESEVLIEIAAVKDSYIEAILKHPLAERNIVFDIEVLHVSDPIPPPLPPTAFSED